MLGHRAKVQEKMFSVNKTALKAFQLFKHIHTANHELQHVLYTLQEAFILCWEMVIPPKQCQTRNLFVANLKAQFEGNYVLLTSHNHLLKIAQYAHKTGVERGGVSCVTEHRGMVEERDVTDGRGLERRVQDKWEAIVAVMVYAYRGRL